MNNFTQPPKEVINNLIKLFNQKQLKSVIDHAHALTAEYPKAFTVWNILGAANKSLGKNIEASQAFKKVTQLNPTYSEGYNNLAITLRDQGKLDEALKLSKKALLLNPKSAIFYTNLGLIYQDQNKFDKAIESYNKAVAINSNYAEAYYNMGNTLQYQDKLAEAIESFKKALAIKIDYAEAYLNMGVAFTKQSKHAEAIDAYKKALSLNPNYAEAYYNMGITHNSSERLVEAVASYTQAIKINPNYADAFNNLGNTLREQGKIDEAIDSYIRALSVRSNYPEAYMNMGVTLIDRGKLAEAIETFKKALAIKNDYLEAYLNMGVAFAKQNKHAEAVDTYKKALSIKPDYEIARARQLHHSAHNCDWEAIEEISKLIPKLGIVKQSISPFSLLAFEDAPERHRIRSEIYSTDINPENIIPLQNLSQKTKKRIRIGYFSADFKEHPVAYLIAGVLEQHNRDKFKVFGYSLMSHSRSELRQRLVASFDCFVDISGMGDKDKAFRAREDKIDIAIDLTGYTENNCSKIFAYRIAPIQINYLGFPGTMGATYIDYIVADKRLIPPENQKNFTEKQIYLPNTYMPTDNKREISARYISKKEFNLPEESFVFCCFNNSYKITSEEFDIWMKLLNKVEKSVLWLRKSNHVSEANLKNEAIKRKIDSSRLVFAEMILIKDHLARYQLADLFLDTFNFNAHTTASEALWAGLPVITKVGKGFPARVASSLLHAINLPELITKNKKDYEALALELATKPKKLSLIKEKLLANRLSQPLFNTEQYTKFLEDGYKQAYQNYLIGHDPQNIIVS